MFTTRTGGFPIGFRRGWSDWQKDLDALVAWAKENGFAVIDLGSDADEVGKAVQAAGLGIGSADLRDWSGFLNPDPGVRRAAVEKNAEYIAAASKVGALNYFCVMLPADPKRPRAENYGYMIESFSELVPHLEAHGAHVVIEGWPGEGALCCTPEGYRAILKDIPSPAIGINYDPSHLIRMGIDPIRFVGEFADRVFHVHGKDTEIFSENIYEYGTEQPPTFGKTHGFGWTTWRYTIPGHGEMRWTKAFQILKDAGYAGAVSIELEDENFNVGEEGEKAGLLAGAAYLATV
jgi:sugar phosphate isomerase/epimerase